MIYSNACAYAIMGLARLAMIRPDGYILMEELCEGSDLPRHFVAKIFQDLVRKGLLVSAKGRGGGFALARTADKITLLDVVVIVDGDELLDRCVVGLTQCNDQQPCPHHDHWKPIRAQIKKFLAETSIQAMADSLRIKLTQLGQPLPQAKSKSKPVRLTAE